MSEHLRLIETALGTEVVLLPRLDEEQRPARVWGLYAGPSLQEHYASAAVAEIDRRTLIEHDLRRGHFTTREDAERSWTVCEIDVLAEPIEGDLLDG